MSRRRLNVQAISSGFPGGPPNNRLEVARVARPTRKGEAPLFAAQPERWAKQIVFKAA